MLNAIRLANKIGLEWTNNIFYMMLKHLLENEKK